MLNCEHLLYCLQLVLQDVCRVNSQIYWVCVCVFSPPPPAHFFHPLLGCKTYAFSCNARDQCWDLKVVFVLLVRAQPPVKTKASSPRGNVRRGLFSVLFSRQTCCHLPYNGFLKIEVTRQTGRMNPPRWMMWDKDSVKRTFPKLDDVHDWSSFPDTINRLGNYRQEWWFSG